MFAKRTSGSYCSNGLHHRTLCNVIGGRHRRRIALAGGAAVACCLALSVWAGVQAHESAQSRAVSSVVLVPHRSGPSGQPQRPGTRTPLLTVAAPLSACEARIARQPHQLPTVAIVGASYTAGEGPGDPRLSWAVGLARELRWNAVIDGVPGAGYVKPSKTGRGPMARMLREEGLDRLSPALVIVQAGHDDLGVPPAVERQRVDATVALIRRTAPRARIALLTTFASQPDGTPALRDIDQAIVTAGAAADPGAIIIDPLAARWQYGRSRDGLHPDAAGDQWIARTMAGILLGHGVRPAPPGATVPVICDQSVGVRQPPSTAAGAHRSPVLAATPV
jgi:lysophospholipase L1-like esterase